MKIDADWLKNSVLQRLFSLLTDAGYDAYAVGGCVRNTLLNVPVTDIDVSTNARPEVVTKLAVSAGFKAVPTGIDHGTVTIVIAKEAFEVTTFRKDIETDGRRAVVAFADTLEEDARRRDFTMNALYADAQGRVHDPVGGLPDLKARRFRFIDDPAQRIKEDYLRILRFFRFHAWYGTDGFDQDSFAACAAHVDGLETLSKERIGQEMVKLLSAANPAPSVASMAACGALMRVLPGAVSDTLAVLVHIEGALGLPPEPMRRLAAIGGEDTVSNLRLSKVQARKLVDLKASDDPIALGYLYGSMGQDILAVRMASLGQEPTEEDIADAKLGIGAEFPVTAQDLMPRYQGAALGAVLNKLKAHWIAARFEISKDALLKTLP